METAGYSEHVVDAVHSLGPWQLYVRGCHLTDNDSAHHLHYNNISTEQNDVINFCLSQ